jgi:hypothetical protein
VCLRKNGAYIKHTLLGECDVLENLLRSKFICCKRSARVRKKSFKNIISWLLVFRAKTISSLKFSSSFFFEIVAEKIWMKTCTREVERKFEFDTICTTTRLLMKSSRDNLPSHSLSHSHLQIQSIHYIFFVSVCLAYRTTKCEDEKVSLWKIPLIDQQSHLSPQ